MSQLPASHDGSLERLVEEGYEIAFLDEKYIAISVAYLDAAGALQSGLLVDPANSIKPNVIGKPKSHQFYFVGSQPYAENGQPVRNLGDTRTARSHKLGSVTASFHLSNKLINPQTGQIREFTSLYEKVLTYVSQISGPALIKFPEADKILKPALSLGAPSVFRFSDAHSAHAEIDDLNERLAGDRVAIVGLGGTGSYILDFLAKTPVAEIHLFDDDDFHIKNLFRAPGSFVKDDFDQKKVSVFANRYDSIREGIHEHECRFPSPTISVDYFSFVFVCVDSPESRQVIHESLSAKSVPYIDVGLGLDREGGELKGMVRTTLIQPGHAQFITDNAPIPIEAVDEDEYNTNIQIAELNALNATLAVIRFKKWRGFYQDQRTEINSLYVVARNSMISLDTSNA